MKKTEQIERNFAGKRITIEPRFFVQNQQVDEWESFLAGLGINQNDAENIDEIELTISGIRIEEY